jgi:hypothetical protein
MIIKVNHAAVVQLLIIYIPYIMILWIKDIIEKN